MRPTSLKAYEEIKRDGTLSTRRLQALEGLVKHEPCTAMELSHWMGVPGLWKRLSELERFGVARPAGVKFCKITGKHAISWEVTGLKPEGRPSRPKKRRGGARCPHCKGSGLMETSIHGQSQA